MAGKIETYIGAENAITPLGWSIQENFRQAISGKTGLAWLEKPFDHIDRIFAGRIDFQTPKKRPIVAISEASIQGSLSGFQWEKTKNDRWLFVLCTTKGDIDHLKNGDLAKANPHRLQEELRQNLPFSSAGAVISCACISSLAGLIYAADKIEYGLYDHAVVLGVDLLSEFTTLGFESFFALESGQCRPFDRDRKGLNLGEGAASVILSNNPGLFADPALRFLGGATSNDANHISGPSRTGEGLVRAIQSTLKRANRSADSIDFISAHGTGTPFNDDMESIAFSRLGLSKVPVNSFKGYFGHALGASGLLELAMTMQSMREGVLLKTLGCEHIGTAESVNILLENTVQNVSTSLKTGSGFGGCNAAVLVAKS